MVDELSARGLITTAELGIMVGDSNPIRWARRHGLVPRQRVRVPGLRGSPAALWDQREVSDLMISLQTRQQS